MIMQGYAKLTGKTTTDSPGVLGLLKNYKDGSTAVDGDGKPYTILAFGNGPNRVTDRSAMTTLTDDTVGANNYLQETAIRLSSETHGGTDVFLGAIGMNSQLFTGTIDNTEVFKLVLKAFGL